MSDIVRQFGYAGQGQGYLGQNYYSPPFSWYWGYIPGYFGYNIPGYGGYNMPGYGGYYGPGYGGHHGYEDHEDYDHEDHGGYYGGGYGSYGGVGGYWNAYPFMGFGSSYYGY
jgi:hypothetical protein